MGSRKRSAREKERAAFFEGLGGMDDAFEREDARIRQERHEAEEARLRRSCLSKQRYATRAEALAAVQSCAEHGRSGLSVYRCSSCGGWHLTSHPWKDGS